MTHTYQTADKDDDPIAAAIERDNEYWQSVGGRDPGPTYQPGWKERWELMLDKLERGEA